MVSSILTLDFLAVTEMARAYSIGFKKMRE